MSDLRERLGHLNSLRRTIAMEKEHEVHSFLIYICEKCGAVYVMYLEKGLADENSRIHKPVPFRIACPECLGPAEHAMNIDRRLGKLDSYRYLEKGENFFMNDPYSDCGIPIIFQKDYERLNIDALSSIISRWWERDARFREDNTTFKLIRREIIEKFVEEKS